MYLNTSLFFSSVLPSIEEMDLPFTWPEDDLSPLEPCPLYYEIKKQKQKVLDGYEEVISALGSHNKFSVEDWVWARGIVISRPFYMVSFFNGKSSSQRETISPVSSLIRVWETTKPYSNIQHVL